MFFDESKIRKVNMGDKKVITKDEFMKKIKDEKSKEVEKMKIAESNLKIQKFLQKNKYKFIHLNIFTNVLYNLKTVLNFLNTNRDMNSIQKEKIALATFDKTLKEINIIFTSVNITNSNLNEMTKIILEILKYLNESNLSNFVINQTNLFKNMLISSIINFYIFIKKDYLIDERIAFFLILQFIQLNNLENILLQQDKIFKFISKNISTIYLLNTILRNSHKILNEISKSLLLKFILNINYKIGEKRIEYRDKLAENYNYCFSNKIIENFIESSILFYLENYSIIKNINLDLLIFFTSPVDNNFLIFLNEEKLFKILLDVSNSINTISERKTIKINHIEFFNHLFQNLTRKLTTSNINNILKKNLLIDKKIILKSINDILELIMETPEKLKMMENFINLIYNAGKFIESLYHSQFEKTDFHSILDYILNKLAMKYQSNTKLLDEILIYSVNILSNKKLNTLCTEETLEIISFALLNKIDYKENYFFLEFKTSKDIYQNLPFNFLYLNLMSKLLINIFTNLIYKTNLDEIEKLNQNLIIKCLKALYMLDADIEFTPNRETFWTNMELISKFSGYSQTKQVESMKIMPFVFPFNYRLKVMYDHFKNVKKTRGLQMMNEYDEYEGSNNSPFDTNLIISREHLFDETLNLYLNNRLRPFMRWKITFVDRFGNREEGVDAGGLYKEFMYKLSESAFSNQTGFFIESNSGFLMPNPNSSTLSPIHLQIFEFLGFICGVGLVDDIKLWPNFSLFFLNNILEVENPFTELKSYDPELYKNLVNLKNYEGDVENDYGLNFTINETKDDKLITVELIPNGKNINVNNSNKLLYINKVAQYKLSIQIREQCESFRRGLLKVCDEDVMKVFTADEMRQLIYGFDKETIDVIDMKMNTEYGNYQIFYLFNLEHNWDFSRQTENDAVRYFWEILEEFDTKEREKLLFFVTSLKRPPVGGFKKLIPRFKLAKSSKEVPTASTCTNMILLPVLPKNKMREILKYVINADAGFYYG